ncbi:MAG: ABC transporter permease [Xanthobacteraceae bacterium]|nr:ABC transporter permease [Xanthobacteraceae bacterium]MCW5679098.1 ABC transporter permease [Xanthobacteraceae bacterium]
MSAFANTIMKPRYAILRQIVMLGIVLGLWELAGIYGYLNPLYMPRPSAIGVTLRDLFSDSKIWVHMQATFTAALLGLALGVLAGVVFGILAALVRVISELIEPIMLVLNAIPRVILAPLFLIWFGIGLGSKVALAFVLVAVVIFFNVFGSIRNIDRRLVERVITLGGGRWALIRQVYLPSVAASVLHNLKVSVGFAFTGAVVGEFVGSSRGLGYLIQFAQSSYNASLMMALVLLILIVVLIIFAIANQIEKYLMQWR